MGPAIQISPVSPIGTSRPFSSTTTTSAQGTGTPTVWRWSEMRPGGMMVVGDVVSVAPYALRKVRLGRRRSNSAMVASGIGAPPKPPIFIADRSKLSKSGSRSIRLYIAGTMMLCVMRSRAVSSSAARALNSRIITTQPPTLSKLSNCATIPVTWVIGTAIKVRSVSVMPMQCW